VRGLEAGVAYRAVVRFRWHDKNGKVIRRATRRSGECVQDGDLPNLELLSVTVSRGQTPGTARYAIDVGNTGDGPAEFFTIALFVTSAGQEAEVDSREIERIDPGETETINFNGPACSSFRAVVDRGHSVPETIEDDNVLKSRC
jgi:CARDB